MEATRDPRRATDHRCGSMTLRRKAKKRKVLTRKPR
jgi:ribosomal protein L40E